MSALTFWRPSVAHADFARCSNTGRTIYSDRTDEELRKAAMEAEEQLRYKRARQKIEQELNTEEASEPRPGWTSDAKES